MTIDYVLLFISLYEQVWKCGALREGSVWLCGNIPNRGGNSPYLSHAGVVGDLQTGRRNAQVLPFPTIIHSQGALVSPVLHEATKEERWRFAPWCLWNTRSSAGIVLSKILLREWINNCHLRPWLIHHIFINWCFESLAKLMHFLILKYAYTILRCFPSLQM